MTSLAGSLLLLTLSQAGLTVRGESVCPTRKEVERLVTALAPEVHEALVATLVSEGEVLTVDLHGPTGLLVARKRFTADNCAVLAEAAAVFLATWVQQLQLTETDAPPPEVTVAPGAPGPRLGVEVSAGVVGEVVGGAVGLGASVDVTLHGREQPWGASLAVVLGPRAASSLEGGSFARRRSFARLGGAFRPQWRRLVVELRGEVVGAVLWLAGRGFDENYTVMRFAPGLGGSARAGVQLGDFRPFVSVMGTGWLVPETVAVVDAPGTRPLPRFELLFALGCAWQVP